MKNPALSVHVLLLQWLAAKPVRFKNGSVISIHILTCTWFLFYDRITINLF